MAAFTGILPTGVKVRHRRRRGLAAERLSLEVMASLDAATMPDEVAALARLARRVDTLAQRSAGLRGFAR